MFQKNDLIVYGNTGICRVEEIGTPESLPGVDKGKLYYKLVPVRSASTIYTPVDTHVFMRPAMTKEEADQLIDRIPQISEDSFECRDPRVLAEHYRTSLQTHECEDLVRLIKSWFRMERNLERPISNIANVQKNCSTKNCPWRWASPMMRYLPILSSEFPVWKWRRGHKSAKNPDDKKPGCLLFIKTDGPIFSARFRNINCTYNHVSIYSCRPQAHSSHSVSFPTIEVGSMPCRL